MSNKLYSAVYKKAGIRVYGRHELHGGRHYIRVEAGLLYPIDRETLREEKGKV